jgi:hypothetical protein
MPKMLAAVMVTKNDEHPETRNLIFLRCGFLGSPPESVPEVF